ncbi:uncharacterized protein BO95DRAFT_111416 [Aspergillus brunneoviolaceus CBS 621.78]|uniref:Uncharacterized protein n=1 Tax=Aspergillus brunneoviolaceus CBS 621.78 TaxID=1450534 RepID=A0ACD1GAY9_9EURO|nr:hypothetical protein BO95DRAFT_111416 [Aspergillus brunneoviolaceus CBS 621.78]RAH46400.1 hypothetical protein BO95DRAFT_111416 [Aspergillus brunneoviolaceus CBS 621.78]
MDGMGGTRTQTITNEQLSYDLVLVAVCPSDWSQSPITDSLYSKSHHHHHHIAFHFRRGEGEGGESGLSNSFEVMPECCHSP